MEGEAGDFSERAEGGHDVDGAGASHFDIVFDGDGGGEVVIEFVGNMVEWLYFVVSFKPVKPGFETAGLHGGWKGMGEGKWKGVNVDLG